MWLCLREISINVNKLFIVICCYFCILFTLSPFFYCTAVVACLLLYAFFCTYVVVTFLFIHWFLYGIHFGAVFGRLTFWNYKEDCLSFYDKLSASHTIIATYPAIQVEIKKFVRKYAGKVMIYPHALAWDLLYFDVYQRLKRSNTSSLARRLHQN